ncbi:MAG: hypothetical protein ABIL70_03755 [candidate division WOR-3 bacterium]
MFGYYNKSLEILEEIGDQMGKVVLIRNIGKIYFELGDDKKGTKYLILAEKIGKKIGHKEVLRMVYTSLAELLLIRNKMEDASIYAELSQKLAEELKSRQGRSRGIAFMGKD